MTELQLAEEATPEDIPDHADWWAERKLDGVRAYTSEGRLLTRRGTDITQGFPEIDPPEHHVLDGEIVTADFSFESALRRVQTEDSFKISLLADRYPARLVVFDALVVNDGDLRGDPLRDRVGYIEPSITSDDGITPITTHGDPEALWDRATTEGWEGIMLKDPDAPYEGGRGRRWLKVKDWSEGVFPITEYEHTENDGFVIYVALPNNGEPQKVAVNGRDDQREIEAGAERAEIQYLEVSKEDRLRKPSFRGVVG